LVGQTFLSVTRRGTPRLVL